MLVLLGASLLLFVVLKSAPADEHRGLRLNRGATEVSGEASTPAKTDGTQSSLSEYATWVGSVVRGQFGVSSALQKGRPAGDLIWPAAGRSFLLLAAAMVISALLALFFASWSLIKPLSIWPSAVGGLVNFLSAIPVFLFVYGSVSGGNRLVKWGAESGLWDLPHWFPLPMEAAFVPWLMAALIVAVGDGGLMDLFHRFRSELEHAGRGEYMTGSRVLGLSIPLEIARAFIPGAFNHLGRRISFFLGSLVVLEAALGWPGLGYLAWRAAAERDMPVLLGSALVMAAAIRVAYMAFNAVGYGADPRLRSE